MQPSKCHANPPSVIKSYPILKTLFQVVESGRIWKENMSNCRQPAPCILWMLMAWHCWMLWQWPGLKPIHSQNRRCVKWSAILLHVNTLQWRHNGLDGVSNHQPHHCLLSRLFRHWSKKTSKLRVTGLCVRGIHRWPVNSPHKWPVTL